MSLIQPHFEWTGHYHITKYNPLKFANISAHQISCMITKNQVRRPLRPGGFPRKLNRDRHDKWIRARIMCYRISPKILHSREREKAARTFNPVNCKINPLIIVKRLEVFWCRANCLEYCCCAACKMAPKAKFYLSVWHWHRDWDHIQKHAGKFSLHHTGIGCEARQEFMVLIYQFSGMKMFVV